MNDDMDHETLSTTSPEAPASTAPVSGFAVAPPETRRGPGIHVATIVGILALLGGSVFAVKNISGSKSGGNSPEGAVAALLNAAENEDLIGVLQQLAPGERDAMREPIERIRNELVRLGMLQKNASLSAFPGIDIEFEDVKYSTTQLDQNVAVVDMTSGTAKTTVDVSKLPLGSFLRAMTAGASPETSTERFEAGESKLTTIKVDGRWYVSLYYTIAESARREAGAPVPAFGQGIQARGEASPEKAVEAAIRSGAAFDVAKVLAVLPPDEMAALHDYAQLFINETMSSIRESTAGASVKITALALDSEKLGNDSALVFIRKFGFAVTRQRESFSVAYDGKCLSSTGIAILPQKLCGDDLRESQQEIFPVRQGKIGFVAVERGGDWYLSPTRTLLEGIVATLKALQPGDIEKIPSLLGQFWSGFGGTRSAQDLPEQFQPGDFVPPDAFVPPGFIPA